MHSCLPGKKMPSCNKTVEKRMNENKRDDYYEKLQNVKPQLEITPPREYHHLQLSVKKIQMQQERQAAIDRQNQVILTQLMKIKQSPARVDNWNKSWKPSNDRLRSFRDRKQRVIRLENEKQVERLKNVQPYYNVDDWEKDYKKHKYYLWLLDGGGIDIEESEESDEEEDGEEKNGELPPLSPSPEAGKTAKTKKEEKVKLPPIDGKKKGKDGGKKKEDYPEHIVIMDAEDVHKAIEENDKERILQILGRVSEKKKLDKLGAKYKELYDKDLMEEVKPKLDEELQEMLDYLGSGAEEDATKLHEAMKGLGTDEDILIEILCTRTNAELKEIRSAYSRKYENDLETDLKGDTSGDLENLLVELSKGQRDESTEVVKELAKTDAKELQEAGVKSWGTDEGKFIRIFTQRSRPQLGATFPEYKKLTNADIADTIDSEMDGDLQKAFLTLVKCVRNPTGFHSDKLHKALEEGDTKTVARIILSKNKVQLDELVMAYRKSYKVDLSDEIEKKCNGDMKTLILAKLGKGKEKRKPQKEKQSPEKLDKAKKEFAKEKPKPKQEKARTEKSKEEKEKEAKEEEALQKDVDELHKAIEAGDKTKIVEILAKHCTERSKLKKLKDKYKKKHDQDVLEAMRPKLDDEDLEDAIESLLMESSVLDAKSVYNAMKDLGTNEEMLIGVLCTRKNAELKDISAAYNKMYGRSFAEDLKSETSGDLQTFLVELSKGTRSESSKVDKEMAKKDAQELLEAGVESWGTDESKFIRIFTQRSRLQLGATFSEYKKLTKKDIADSIDSEMDGDLQTAFLTLLKCVRDPTGYSSNSLHEALSEGDTKKGARIIVTKDKAQLDELVAAYKKAHKTDVADEIEKKCEGEVKTLLLAKLGRAKAKKGAQKQAPAKENQRAKPAARANKKSEQTNMKAEKPAEKSKEEKEGVPEKDADELHEAIEADDKTKIIDVLARHCDERSKLEKLKGRYKEKHNQDLLEAIKPKLHEDLHDAVESLLMEGAFYDAKSLYNSMKGLGTDEDVLIEILCSRDNSELAKIREAYTSNYGRSLERDIKGDTSGHFEDLLVELSKGNRDESTKVDRSLAKKDAEALLQAGYLGTDENKFVEVFTLRSFSHLKIVFVEYKKIANTDMDESIEDEMSQDLEKGFLTLVKFVKDPSKFYADKLQKSLNDGDTETAGRIILTSTKAELAGIMAAYKKYHGTDLGKEAEAKFGQDMKKLVVVKLKTGSQGLKEKEKAANDPNGTTASTGKRKQGGKQDGSVVKKETKTVASKPPSKRQLLDKNEPEQNQDFSDLRKAIDADDKERIKGIICRNLSDKNKARKLVDDYNARYNKELLEMLEGKLEEDLIEALAGMSYSSAQHDAWSLHQAMKGLGTKELVLIETFATRTNAEISAIRQAYKKMYRKLLEEDIRDETSGDFETLIVELSKGQRDETATVNDDLAHKDAETLLEAGIKKWGTDEEKFIEIFTTRSFPQLSAMLPEYKEWAKCEIEDTIDSEMSGNLRDGLKSLVACIRDQDKFLANKLHDSLQSKSTVDTTRIILGMGESEIAEVEKAYNSTFKPKLAVEVENKCSDELKKVLLTKLKDKGTDEELQKDAPEEKPHTQEQPLSKPSQPVGMSQESASDQKPTEGKPMEQALKEKKEDRPKLNVKMEYHATLKPAENFDAKDDASQLKSAMRGFGSDEDAIMAILGARTRKQRQEIAVTFQKEYDKNLVDELKSELSGKFEDAIVALMSSPELYDANSLHEAMSGLGTDESVLVEILCSRSFEEIKAIKGVYKQVHSKDLVEEIKDETSGDLQTTLVSLAQGERDASEQLNEDLAYEDAHNLLEAGENKWGTDESVFIKILTSRSLTQLQATFEAYKNVAKTDIMESVNDELTGDFHDVVEAIVRCTRNPPLFFAEVLEKGLGDFTVDSKAVTRVLVTRAEIDLAEIKGEYEKKTGEALKVAVESRLKGDLEKLLLQIVGD